MFDFLFEMLVEEIPHGVLPKAAAQIKELLPPLLEKYGLSNQGITYYASPRRLAFLVRGLPAAGASRTIEQKGPSLKAAYTPEGKPAPALEGFFKSYGVSEPDLIRKESKGQVYFFIHKVEEGRPLPRLLGEVMGSFIPALKFSEPMRWNKNGAVYEFIRPVRALTALINDQVLPLSFFGVESGDLLFGHRQLFPQPVRLANASRYEETLRAAGVIPSLEERKEEIRAQVQAIAQSLNAEAGLDEELLSILACLTEQPHALAASFDPKFLEIPKEVLVSEMKVHQKYIPLFSKKEGLMPHYIITANVPCADAETKANVLKGNNRVFNARAEDGAFFYKEDLKKGMEYYRSTLGSVTFVEGGGSLADKTARMHRLAAILQKQLGYAPDSEELSCTLEYAKADLASLMVGEFPELQGLMGSYYAAAAGFPQGAVRAIKEQYDPLGVEAPAPLSGFAGLTDRLDSLCTLYAVGKTVTGSRDPYALRRQTIAAIHILIRFGWDRFSVDAFLDEALPLYKEMLVLPENEWKTLLKEFIQARLEGILKGEGCASDTVGAVLAAGFGHILDDIGRARTLQALRSSEPRTLASLAELSKRIKNILKGQTPALLKETLLEEAAEKALYAKVAAVENDFTSFSTERAFRELLGLEPFVADFFEAVMVKCGGETEQNRIALLQKIDVLFERLADFSRLSLES